MKSDILRRELNGDGTGLHKMTEFEDGGLTCPLDPNIKLYGVIPKECNVFKSAVQPMKMTFTCRKFSSNLEERNIQSLPELETYSIVFKNGDDTR